MVESTVPVSSGKKYVIFGATGNTGLQLVSQGLAQGNHITAYIRNPEKLLAALPEATKVNIIKGELDNLEEMEKAIQGQDAVIVSLGGKGLFSRDTTCSIGTKAIIGVMQKTGVKKLSVLSSYGVGPGNRALLGWAIRAMLYHPLADKDEQEDFIIKSGLDYTIVRPPRLMDVPAKGNIHATVSGRLPTMEISRADVAAFMLQSLAENSYSGQAVSISWAAGTPSEAPKAQK